MANRRSTVRARIGNYIGNFSEPSILSVEELNFIIELVITRKWNETTAILFSRECVIRRLMAEESWMRRDSKND